MQVNCRYGPGKAYLYSHGLYEGDQAEIHGRNYGSTWLWVKPDQIDRHCWVAASVVDVSGDLESVLIAVNTRLPYTTFIDPPELVQAYREGDQVVVSWTPVVVKPAEDGRGYLIEASVCQNGVLISNGQGKVLGYALAALQERGKLFVNPGDEVYEGQIVGLHSRSNDLTVNPLKGKQLTNIRASGKDDAIQLTPPVKFSLEQALEFIEGDELVELTPGAIRIRKKHLKEHERKKASRESK